MLVINKCVRFLNVKRPSPASESINSLSLPASIKLYMALHNKYSQHHLQQTAVAVFAEPLHPQHQEHLAGAAAAQLLHLLLMDNRQQGRQQGGRPEA